MGQGPKWTEAKRASSLAKLIERNRSTRAGSFLYEDLRWMEDAYLVRKLTMRQMAAEAGCGLRTIARWMTIHGIESDCSRRPLRATGPANHNWKGGPPKCEVCQTIVSFGRKRCMAHRDFSGDKNPTWRGEQVGYTGLHYRLVANRGKASAHTCQHCGGAAREWAYDHADPNEKRDLDKRDHQPYSLDLHHYIPLCTKCHRRFDLGK